MEAEATVEDMVAVGLGEVVEDVEGVDLEVDLEVVKDSAAAVEDPAGVDSEVVKDSAEGVEDTEAVDLGVEGKVVLAVGVMENAEIGNHIRVNFSNLALDTIPYTYIQ